MKFTLTIETNDDRVHPVNVALLVQSVAKQLLKDFNGESAPKESHVGKVQGDGWLKEYSGSWRYDP